MERFLTRAKACPPKSACHAGAACTPSCKRHYSNVDHLGDAPLQSLLAGCMLNGVVVAEKGLVPSESPCGIRQSTLCALISAKGTKEPGRSGKNREKFTGR